MTGVQEIIHPTAIVKVSLKWSFLISLCSYYWTSVIRKFSKYRHDSACRIPLHSCLLQKTINSYLTLCQFIIVMWEFQINAASVNIKSLTANIWCHNRTFDVPSRSAVTPCTWPPWFAWFACLPQCKIIWWSFFAQAIFRNAQITFTLLQWFRITVGFWHQFSIMVMFSGIEFRNIEINRTIRFISQTIWNDLFNVSYDLWNIFTDACQNIRWKNLKNRKLR